MHADVLYVNTIPVTVNVDQGIWLFLVIKNRKERL